MPTTMHHQQRSLEDLNTDLVMFPEMVDLAPFREVLTNAETRRTFILGLDVGEQWREWEPHLQAIDELLLSDAVVLQVKGVLGEFVRRDPNMSARILGRLPGKIRKKYRVGALAAKCNRWRPAGYPHGDAGSSGGNAPVVGN